MNKSYRELAIEFINKNQTIYCRNLKEGAKYLIASLSLNTMPHPGVYHEIGMISISY